MTHLRRSGIALAVVTVVASGAICASSWEPHNAADGYLDPDLFKLVFLLPVLVAVVCALDVWAGATAGLAMLAAVFTAVHLAIQRTTSDDGLEVLGYLLPVAVGILTLMLGAVGALAGAPLRRRAQDQ